MSGLLLKYFVLKPSGKDDYHAASRAGMRAYADRIEVANPEMAADLRAWADKEAIAAGEIGEAMNQDGSS